jgi:hypothetical protein
MNAMTSTTKSGMTEGEEERAAAAVVAAITDPSRYEEAQQRFMESALGPYRRGLEGCAAGASDPFIQRHFWTGSGSISRYEKICGELFLDLVAYARRKEEAPSTKR